MSARHRKASALQQLAIEPAEAVQQLEASLAWVLSSIEGDSRAARPLTEDDADAVRRLLWRVEALRRGVGEFAARVEQIASKCETRAGTAETRRWSSARTLQRLVQEST